jgi:hypothetical protein
MRYLVRLEISLVLIAIVCVGLVGTSSAQTNDPQSVLYVQADAAGVGDGTSWADAYTDLQVALAVAEPGNDIWVAAGTYAPRGPNDRTVRTATFQLRSGIGVYGGFVGTETSRDERDPATNLTVLSGDLNGNDLEVLAPPDLMSEPSRSDNSYHVVTGSGADETAVLDGFVITGGNANGSGNTHGGGMINVETVTVPANPTLVNCTFHGNSADRNGGGIYNELGDPTITDCVFSENHGNGAPLGQGGGGVYNARGSLTARQSSIQLSTEIGLPAESKHKMVAASLTNRATLPLSTVPSPETQPSSAGGSLTAKAPPQPSPTAYSPGMRPSGLEAGFRTGSAVPL